MRIEADLSARVTWAMQQNAVPIVHELRLHHDGDEDLEDVLVQISTEPRIHAPWEVRIARIAAGGTHRLARVDLSLRGGALRDLRERQLAELRVVVSTAKGLTHQVDGNERVAQVAFPVELLAWNEWPGTAAPLELLAAYVQPNHSALPFVLKRASTRLAEATGSGSLDAYQTKDPRRVRAIVEAMYESLRAMNLTYVEPPASFEQSGQKIRLADQVFTEEMGTCLDLALVFVACLEQVGLHALLIMMEGHVFPAVWLSDETFADPVQFEPLRIIKRIELQEMLVVETTDLCGPPGMTFADAQEDAVHQLGRGESMMFALDLTPCRRVARILPLGVENHGARSGSGGDDGAFPDGLTTEGSSQDDVPAGSVLEDVASNFDDTLPHAAESSVLPGSTLAAGAVNEAATAPTTPKGRLSHWASKLLDLSLRNRLLNARDTKKVLPLAVEDLAGLEDALAGGRPFRFFPATKRAVGEETDDATSRQAARAAEHEDLKRRRLRVAVTNEELDKRLTQIQREARLSLSETGTNTLFLAVGFLEWFEAPGATQPRRAPLLLLPLEVSGSVARNTLQIELADDEARINTTLLEKLHADFGLPVEGLDVLPEDERGVDVDEVLLRFRRLIRDLDRWQIVPDAWVGFFAFTKLLMWRDLHHGSQTLLQSKLLRHLLLSPEDGFVHEGVSPDPVDLDAQFAPDAVFCPMDADSSQLAAVLAASSGRSFVLEGPPGTGKSQTITNLIAHTLAEGKRVLFVAEKRAALDVVQRRLAKVGLDPFCLVLHSGKGTKKHVVDQLGHTLDFGSIDEPKGWAGRADELEVVRRELNDYVLAIHRLRAPGFSMFEAVAEAAAMRDSASGEATKVQLQVDARGGPHGVSLLLDEATMREHGRLAARAGTASSRIAPLSEHAWRGVGLTTWTPALDGNAAAAVERIADAVSVHREASLAGLKALFNQDSNDGGEASRQLIEWLEKSGTEHAWSCVGNVADVVMRFPKLPAAFLHAPGFDERIEHVEALEGRLEDLEVLRKEVVANFRETVFEEDLPNLRDTFVKHARSGCWGRFFGLRKSKRIVGGHAKVPLGEPMDVAKKLSRVEQYVALRDALDDMPEGAAELGELWQGSATDARSLDPIIRKAEGLRGMLRILVPCCDGLETDDVLPDIAEVAERLAEGADATALQKLKDVCEQLGATVDAVAEELQINPHRAWERYPGPAHRDALDVFVTETREAPRGLRDLCAWNAVAEELETVGIEPLAKALVEGSVHGDDAERVFRRAYLEAWIPAVLNEEPELASFRGLEHEDRITRFCQLDREVIDMAGDVVRARLAARLPRVGGGGDLRGSEVGTLRREQKKQRRHLPVRVLFETIPNLLPRLAPCMLMSPMSVAQMLPLRDPDQKDARFDLVVFDEASQIPPWDAVGAIGRGTNVVVVGDSKQLPPTNFFQRMSGDGDDEEVIDTEIEDLESILDECSAAGLERMHLRWHYRSQHESLIAFSNHHYYEDLLYTFPSAAARMPGYGVSLRHIDGVYDRAKSQTNRAEADALVAEVVSRAKDPASRGLSLGIVTFSQSQQVLIEDLFDEARRKDRGLDEALSRLGPAEEPFFVKNLENVQGDERDVMLFSICYGPDANGRVFMNFGPVNRQGGERRLNVAVTRARRELVVFSSLRADQIDLSRTRALGARHLKHFLDYADRGPAALRDVAEVAAGGGDYDSPFEKSVARVLEAAGHAVHAQVGCSGFRIDLAVVDPLHPGRYLLGVECDGATYHSAATARDRDRTRQAVLERLGWDLHRVWSTEWWFDQEGETERLMQALAVARERSAERERRHAADVAAARAADAALTASSEGEADGDGSSDSTGEGNDDGTDASQAKDDVVRNGSAPNQAPAVDSLGSASSVNALVGEAPIDAAQDAVLPDAEADEAVRGTADESTQETATANESVGESGVSTNEPSSDLPSLTPSDSASESPEGSAPDLRETSSASGPSDYATCRPLPTAKGFHDPKRMAAIIAALKQVVEEEGPVLFDRAARRVAEAFHESRFTSRVERRMQDALTASKIRTTPDPLVLWSEGQDPTTWRGFRRPVGKEERGSRELPIVEIANAAAWVMQGAIAMEREDLLRATAKEFGISRLGSAVRESMDAGVQLAVERGDAVFDAEGTRVRLP